MSPGGIKRGGGEWVMVSSWKRLFSEVLKGDYFGLIGILAFGEDLFLPNYAELGYPWKMLP